MADQDYKARHNAAMQNPQTPEENMLVELTYRLDILANRYKDDAAMIPAVEKLGSAIISLLNDNTGRLDQGLLDAHVRAEVAAAGGDTDDL